MGKDPLKPWDTSWCSERNYDVNDTSAEATEIKSETLNNKQTKQNKSRPGHKFETLFMT